MDLIRGVARDYAWGSTSAIQRYLHQPEDGRPLAEVWYGAHPSAPSALAGEEATLLDVITADPQRTLGSTTIDTFGPVLPFLVKLLAPGQAVSLQAHPSAANARAGFDREEAAGIAIDAFERSFKDPMHKPEMIHALTDFEGLVGFRPIPQIATLLASIGTAPTKAIAGALAQTPDLQGLKSALRDVMQLDRSQVSAAVHAIACGDDLPPDSVALVERLAATYAGDAGVIAALMLNHVRLAPGESVYVESGVPHSYLDGLAVEIMANSDNVLRAGLTSKYVDVEGMLDNVLLTEHPYPVISAHELVPGYAVVPSPAQEFALSIIEPRDDRQLVVSSRGPRLVLGVAGAITVAASGEEIAIAPGDAVFVPDADGSVSASGDGRAVMASLP